MREHRCLLKANKHAEKLLQESWNILGEHQFIIISLEELNENCSLHQKREAELKWMQLYDKYNLLYNKNRTSFRPTDAAIEKSRLMNPNKGKIQSPESNIKRRLSQLGKPKGHGAKISATKQAKKLMR